MAKPVPHDPYIAEVVNYLTTAGLEPDDWWTSDAEIDPYVGGPDAGVTTMLSAVLAWSGDHAAIADAVAPDGILLLWEHPAEQWQYAERRAGGGNEEPEFVPALPLLAHPAGVVEVVRELLAGHPVPADARIPWHRAGEVRDAIDAWETQD